MRKEKLHALALMLGIIFVITAETQAQIRSVGPGSTVQGDILRGEGVFLQGAAWYDLNEAKAMAVNVDTARKIAEWNQQVFDAYMRERAAHIAQRRNLTLRQQEAAKRSFEEREKRLRTKPTSEDIQSGEALNAMLLDLSDPTIAESSWRLAKVGLPAELSIRLLGFRFAPKAGTKASQALGRGVIALARLDLEGRWPSFLLMDALATERKAYEVAYRTVREQSLAGKLEIDSILGMDKAIDALKAKVSVAVPSERGYRATAARFVEDLRSVTKMFDAETLDYAREMISDTQNHQALTVGELLAFMRKYRLLFASAEKSLGGGEMYGRLYGLLREQKEELGMKPDQFLTTQPNVRETASSLPVGKWKTQYNIDVQAVCEVRPDGTVHHSDSIKREEEGTIRAEANSFILNYSTFVERWSPRGNSFAVEHFHPKTSYPSGGPSHSGTATKL